MKKCSYCGKEYPDDAVQCMIDEQPLISPGKPLTSHFSLPVNEKEKEWIENSFQWFLETFGRDEFLKHKTILPDASFFPDKYNGTEEAVDRVVERVCNYMDVNPNLIEIGFLEDLQQREPSEGTTGYRSHDGAAGLYYPKSEEGSRKKIVLNVSLFKNPTKLVGTIAHELGHFILLGGGKITSQQEDHEYLKDLLTVFLGLGVFTANSAFQFSQWQDTTHQGWSSSRAGYMTEEMYGYSLALYAWTRNDKKPTWLKFLNMNVAHYLKQSLEYFEEGRSSFLNDSTR